MIKEKLSLMVGSFHNNLSALLEKYEEHKEKLIDPQNLSREDFIATSRQMAQMEPLTQAIKIFFQVKKELQDAKNLLKDTDLKDVDLKKMVQDEIETLSKALEEKEWQVRYLLLPKDEDAARNVILEIRPGTGGDEAALFGSDLLRMYSRYAEFKGWAIEVLNIQTTDQGGVKEVSLNISGKDVYGHLKWEAGVHRVQRVPTTEASGRIHTSAATVAILPEAEEVDILIEEKDLRIDVFRSSGPGGQSVNTTDSAVRITHIPTGIVVQQQDEKSQHKNKAKALKILRARLYDLKKIEQEEERSSFRQNQVGRGDRSERIRTYNFPQGRMTDHRFKLTSHRLQDILQGAALEEVIEKIREQDVLDQMSKSIETENQI